MEISLKEANKEVFAELLAFYRTYYSEDNRIFDPRYLDWLLLENPAGQGLLVTFTFEGQIIGNMFLVATAVIKNGEVKKGYFATDVLTHPDHRDKSVFVKLIRTSVDHLKANGQFLLGHPNVYAVPGWKRCKMQFFPEIISLPAKPAMPFSGVQTKALTSKSDVQSLADDIQRSLLTAERVVVNADADYLAWRFLGHPTQTYALHAVYKGDEFCGVMASYKAKGIIDKVIHFSAMKGREKAVINSSVVPKVFSLPKDMMEGELAPYFVNKEVGTEMKFFYTDFAADGENDTVNISFAASDI